MPIRTTRKQVSFRSPFRLPEIDEELPAGVYDVDIDEQAIEGNERTVFIRVATLIYLRGLGSTRTITIDPAGLEAALEKDRECTGGSAGS